MLKPVIMFHFISQFVSVHDRHEDVAYDNSRPGFPCNIKTLPAVCRKEDFIAAIFKKVFELLGLCRAVLNDQYTDLFVHLTIRLTIRLIIRLIIRQVGSCPKREYSAYP